MINIFSSQKTSYFLAFVLIGSFFCEKTYCKGKKNLKKPQIQAGTKSGRKKFPMEFFFPNGLTHINKIFLPMKVEYISPSEIAPKKDYIQTDPSLFEYSSREIILPGFIGEKDVKGDCVFVGGIKGEELYFMKEGAVCRVLDDLELKRKYTVIRKVTNDLFKRTFLYYYIATVVLEKFLGRDKYAKVKILRSRMEIEEGDIVVPEVSFDRVISLKEKKVSSLESPGSIVGFGSREQTIGGSGELVFIDRGREDSVAIDKVYAIHRTNRWEKVYASATKYVVNDLFLVGKLLIVEASSIGSIGYIYEVNSEVYIGDQIGIEMTPQ